MDETTLADLEKRLRALQTRWQNLNYQNHVTLHGDPFIYDRANMEQAAEFASGVLESLHLQGLNPSYSQAAFPTVERLIPEMEAATDALEKQQGAANA